jgi:hypothetical protein
MYPSMNTRSIRDRVKDFVSRGGSRKKGIAAVIRCKRVLILSYCYSLTPCFRHCRIRHGRTGPGFFEERNRPGCQIRRRAGFPFGWTKKIDLVFDAPPDSTSELIQMAALLSSRIMAREPRMQHPEAILPTAHRGDRWKPFAV